MGLVANFSLSDIRKQFDRFRQESDKAIIQTLSYVGERGVIQARTLNTYRDQTGNLRSSIGYLITRNGRVVKASFEGGQPGGRSAGQLAARSLAGQYPTGYALIVVAGMHYAATVQARGLDVLASAELLTERELPGLLIQLKTQINQLAA